jgi:hypothetical protein
MIGRGDALVIALCAALVAASFAWSTRPRGTPHSALVETSAGERRELPLARDGRFTFAGRRGPAIVEVRGGRARFLDSSCHQKLCVRAGWLARAGDASACLPNGVTLRLLGDEPAYDAVTL